MKRFLDKVVIVTGAASGIGEATAIEFAKEGAKVILADLSEKGQLLSDKMNQDGFETYYFKIDVSKEDEVINLIEKTKNVYGRLDIMFANAGINIEANIDELEFNDWQKVIDVNLTSIYLCNKYAVKQFRSQNGNGVIINTGSIHSLVARDGLAAYAAAKGGVKLLTQQMAVKYSKEGIRTNAIAPAYINTPLIKTLSENVIAQLASLHPIGRLGEPVEVARTVLFLASDDASFITGVTLPIDGGYTAT